jgi:hypothetical protein
MNAAATLNTAAPMNLLPAAARFGIAVAVALALCVAWIAAERQSHDAVLVAGTTLSSRVTHITLPSVQIIGKRVAGKANA